MYVLSGIEDLSGDLSELLTYMLSFDIITHFSLWLLPRDSSDDVGSKLCLQAMAIPETGIICRIRIFAIYGN